LIKDQSPFTSGQNAVAAANVTNFYYPDKRNSFYMYKQYAM